MSANTTHQSTRAASTLLGKVLLILPMLLVVQIRPASSADRFTPVQYQGYTGRSEAPIFRNFMNQQEELCRQKQGIFMQGECLSRAL
jgi:hypothetical protein